MALPGKCAPGTPGLRKTQNQYTKSGIQAIIRLR